VERRQARAIQELAGHRDLGMTRRCMHLSPAALESAIRLLERAPAQEILEILETVDAADLLREVAWPAEDGPLAFVCGPTSFVESVAAGLVELGYAPGRIKTERFGATGGR
jgi:ferredoxin-NADP reductase